MRLTRDRRVKAVVSRAKPWPYCTVPRPMERWFLYDFRLTAPHLDAHGAVRFRWHSYVSVGCGFRYCESHGKVRCCDISYGAVRVGIKTRKCYGADRCSFLMSGILRRGSVIFEILRCGSVRVSHFEKPTVRCGAVFKMQKNYGAVRCG